MMALSGWTCHPTLSKGMLVPNPHTQVACVSKAKALILMVAGSPKDSENVLERLGATKSKHDGHAVAKLL